MSIQTEINRLKTAKTNILASLENKGVDTSSVTTLDDIATLIDGISGGSSDVKSGSFTPTENYTSSSQYFEVDLGFKPDAVYVYRKIWASGTQSVNGAFSSSSFKFAVCSTASSNKAAEKLSTSTFITISDTGFKIAGNSTYYLVGGAEYIYLAVK